LIVSTNGGQTFTNDVEGFPEVVNTVFTINGMAFLNGWVFAQLNTGDLFRKKIAIVGGTENIEQENPVTIFPNPAENQLNITTSQKVNSVKIMDISGKVIATDNQSTIDISTLDSGIYLLNIDTDNKNTYRSKFIKSKR